MHYHLFKPGIHYILTWSEHVLHHQRIIETSVRGAHAWVKPHPSTKLPEKSVQYLFIFFA